MHISKRRVFSLVLADVYFAQTISTQLREYDGCDLIHFIYACDSKVDAHLVHTRQINLRLSEETLWKSFSSTTRYEIHRAQERDGLTVRMNNRPSSSDVREFSEFYDVFAAQKSLRQSRLKKLLALNETGGLVLSQVVGGDQGPLWWHAYAVDGEQAMALYLVSHRHKYTNNSQRSLVGRAHRFLVWEDVKQFKNAGFAVYDLGGLSGASGESAMLGIDEFKRRFGGLDVKRYNYRCGRTLVGKVANLAWQALDRLTMPVGQFNHREFVPRRLEQASENQ